MANQIRQKSKQVKMRGVADIVFCFDCTASMSEIIKNVKDNVNEFIDSFKTFGTELDWRARAMGYRDFEVDEEYLINDKPFVETEADLKAQIASIEAPDGTGGDEPESTLDAIWYAAKKTEWRENCHKIVVVFTDDASKPVNQKTLEDIKGSGEDLDLLSQELQVDHIKLFLWGKTDPIYDALKKIPGADITQLDDPENDFKTMDFSKVMDRIGKTISEMASSGGVAE